MNLTPKKVRFPMNLTPKKVRFPMNSALPFRLLNLPFFYAAGGGGEVHSDPVETAAV